jgi:RNA polymerase subunit RPABC4/transcription elongation factor Spt4
MTNKNQTSTRFKDEIRILSPWAYFIATLVFVAIPVLFVIFVGKDPKAPPFAVRCLLGAIAGTLLACYVVLIGYINRDAGRRGMSRLWWTLIAMFVPNGLGIVLYFILRKPRTAHCPQCAAEIEPGFSFCPRCSNKLSPSCPRCQRVVGANDVYCPYCGTSLRDQEVPQVSQPSR